MIDSGGPGSSMFHNTRLHQAIVVEVVQALQQISYHREHHSIVKSSKLFASSQTRSITAHFCALTLPTAHQMLCERSTTLIRGWRG